MDRLPRLHVFRALVVLLFTVLPLASVLGQSSLNGHTVKLDASGKLLAWPTVQGDAYDQVLGLATNYLLNGVPTAPNGLKLYYSESYANPGNPVTGAGWPHNPAGLFSMLTDSGLSYYAYSGNVAMANLVRDVLTHQLDHGMTPSNWHWPSVAYASADAGSLTYAGASYGNSSGVGDGVGVIQPDKVGEIGVAFLKYFEFSGATRFRDAAIQAADVLASHVRTGSSTQSPWPFRVYAQTNVVREQYSAHVIAPIKLFDELIRLNLGNVSAYQSARQTALTWLMTYPIQNNVWSNYFEDVPIQSGTSNFNQLIAGETARYLMQHPNVDPNWEAHVRGIITWIEGTFAVPQYGANSIAEQNAFYYPMGSHTSRYASINALLYEITGDQTAREKAYRSLNWATYMTGGNGVVIDGPSVNHIWWTDGYGDYIKHFMASLGSVPEWSPPSQSHLLRSTSVVRSVQYASTDITYQVFDASAQEVLRLNFAPQSVTANGILLPNLSVLTQQGWSFDSATGVMRVRHDSGAQIQISGVPLSNNLPPQVNLNSPVAGNYVTPVSLNLTATANDLDGTIDHVEFLSGNTLLATVPTPPYSFMWPSVPAGSYQLSAVAMDNRGARTTSNAVSVVVTSPALLSPPTNLTATVSAGTVSLSWSPPTGVPLIASYRVYRSTTSGFTPAVGDLVGQTSGPTFSDAGLSGGIYYYKVIAFDTAGNPSAASNQTIATIAGGLEIDKVVFSDGSGTRTSPTISTSKAGELLLAFVASDGPQSGGQTAAVTGGGLTWTLVRRVNSQPGSSEIWKAVASGLLTNATVTSTPGIAGFNQSLTVVSFSGTGGTGASVGASGISAPAVSLTTTKAGSLVYGVGNDWDRAVARTVGDSQSMVHQWVETGVGDTFWVQKRTAPTGAAGSVVQLNDTAPTTDRWNLVAVEILPPANLITVPSLVGQTQAAAQSLITGAGLVVGTVTSQPSATVPLNSVISQSPASGAQAATGSAVNLVVSSGPQLITVPSLVGQTQAAAQSLITGAGLVVGTVTSQPSATVPLNSVISQSPASGAQAATGSAVNLVVSSGPLLIIVPSLVGQTQAAAQSLITGAGLVVGTVTSQPSATVPLNSVISQSPASGAQAATGSAVNLVVSSGPQLITVPSLVGQTQAAAQSLITGAGLVVGTVTSQPSATVPLNSVISQSPASGAQAATGSAVNLVVSSGPLLIIVPSLVGQTQAAAQSLITGAGLVVGTVTSQPSATVPLNSVISQSPASGAQAATGSAVNLVVSSGPSFVLWPTVDKSVFSDGAGTRTTPTFSTAVANEVLLAFVASDGPTSGIQSLSVSGAGLTWTLVKRVTAQRGSSEIWRASATGVLTNVTVTSTPSVSGYRQSLTVVTFRGAAGIGTSATASAASGAPTVTLTTTRANALVYGVGNDWDRAVARTLPASQVMVHQSVDTVVGDTFWVQAWSGPVANAGTTIRLSATAPTNDRWNFAAVEVLP